MLTCFVDESGCPGSLPSLSSSVQPLLVIAGLALDTSAEAPLTRQFARLAQRHEYGHSRPDHRCADLRGELIKGAAVRRAMRKDWAAATQREVPLLDAVLALLAAHNVKLFGTVLVKMPGEPLDGDAAYGRALFEVTRAFHGHLEERATTGLVIADFREAQLNGRVSRELMEAKLGAAGDQLPCLLHLPTFGNSEVHAPLQLTDLVCSALLWPVAAWRFCDELAGSPHLSPEADEAIARRFRKRLAALMPAGSADPGAAMQGKEGEGYRAVPLEEVLGRPLAFTGRRPAETRRQLHRLVGSGAVPGRRAGGRSESVVGAL